MFKMFTKINKDVYKNKDVYNIYCIIPFLSLCGTYKATTITVIIIIINNNLGGKGGGGMLLSSLN